MHFCCVLRCNKLTTVLGRRLDDYDRSEAVSRGNLYSIYCVLLSTLLPYIPPHVNFLPGALAKGIGRVKLLVEGKNKTEELLKLQK